jgi:tRNA dimethylallyltransferase
MNNRPKILVVVGPTASGKTSLSIALAKRFSGEVISADSRQVYRGLDLGSGKVTLPEMDGVRHHLLDIADPMQVYTASDFKHDATTAIAKITAADHLPIVAGGTFLYVDTLLGKISFPAVVPNPKLRAELEQKSTTELFSLLAAKDPTRAATIDKDNPRRLVRALEIIEALGYVPELPNESPYKHLTVGLRLTTEALHHNIHVRLIERLEAGLVDEVKQLLSLDVTPLRLHDLGLEYRYVSLYLQDKIDYETMVTELETKIRQFAKRQLTWLKRDGSILWFDPANREEIFSTVEHFLQD